MNRWFGFFLFFVALSCDDKIASVRCDINPINDLDWLKSKTKEIEANPSNYFSVTISIMEYQGKFVFNVYDAVSSCAYCDLYDCSGNKFMPEYFPDFITNKKNERKIWCQNPTLCN